MDFDAAHIWRRAEVARSYPPLDGEGRREAPGWGAFQSGNVAGQVSATFVNNRKDSVQNCFQFLFHFMIPEAKYAISLALEPQGSRMIMPPLIIKAMMGAVDLDDQLQSMRDEVREIDA
ncbi:hypothetical protein SLT36_23360 [Aminobacter sp. BA135]